MISIEECIRGVEDAFVLTDDEAWRLSNYDLPPYGEPISTYYPARHAGAAVVAKELIFGAVHHAEADMNLEVAPVFRARVVQVGGEYVVAAIRGVTLWRIDVPIPTD